MKERLVEVKLRVPDNDLDRLQSVLRKVGSFVDTVEQKDTFYQATSGLLKLRRSSDGKHTLIWYQRPDTAEIKGAECLKYRTHDFTQLEAVLKMALTVIGRIEKERSLYRLGRLEIHLDAVVGICSYIEVETVLNATEDEKLGRAVVLDALQLLGISHYPLEGMPYFRLTASKGAAS